ncbi:Rha family transcriptional regulator [Acetobacter indonesiensis]|uniref:Rha family transcriptional regulator n=1 Tax=Acetobacter indonesiensis TaxID=104101 RepID=UPI001C4FA199|nr:Rha family transcriptional regulator [Acetobacter indonesiensis]
MSSIITTAAENSSLTMSSREIAELTGSTHDNVLKTIRALIKKGLVFGNETPYVHPQNGQTYKEFHLDYRNTMVVTSGYSVELRAKIIDRWLELEGNSGNRATQKPKRVRKTPIDTRFIQLKRIALASGKDEGQAVICANTGVLNETGYNALEMMGIKALPIEGDEHYYTPTDLGAEFGMSGREVNQILKRAGLQIENPAKSSTASNWLPTEMGKRYGRMQDGVRANGKGSTQTLMWKKEAASFLRPFTKTPARAA